MAEYVNARKYGGGGGGALAVPGGPPPPSGPGEMAVSYKMLDSSKISAHEIQVLRHQIWSMRHPGARGREQLWPPQCRPRETDLKGIATQRVFEWESDTTWFRAYEVEVHKFVGFQYILDFGGTTNHEIQGTFGVQGLRVDANLQPFELETVCLISRNKLDPFKLQVKMQWVTTDVHPAIVDTALQMNQQRLGKEYEMMRNNGVDPQTQDLHTIRQKLRSAGLRFVDETFYPAAASLYIDGEQSDKVIEEQVMWRRAADYCSDPAVFKIDGDDEKDVEPNDVMQGRLGNCWFCCSLASMAERPELIKRLFITKEFNEEGIYEMRFCHNGLWKVVLLDDFFPCKPYSGPIYTKTAEDELWVALLEKAYAKVYGCYERLISGSPYHSLPDLTGCPTEIYELQDPEHVAGLWEKLMDWNKSEDNMMTAACGDSSLVNPYEAGLMLDHSYTILDAQEGLGVRLLCIRNPWGHGEWKGAWSDFSPLWTEKAKQVFNPTLDGDDGLFYMCYEDFLKYFCSLVVAYCRRDWTDARLPVQLEYDQERQELQTEVLRVNVPPGGCLEWVGLYQQDDREQGAPTYLDLAAFIFELKGDTRVPVGFSGNEAARQVFGSFGPVSRENPQVLGEGTYQIIPWTSCRHWDPESGNTRTIALSVHVHSTADRVSMRSEGRATRKDIDQALLELALGLGELKPWHDLERRHLRIGQMDIYAGRNTCRDKILTFSMSGDLDNIQNAVGYPDLAEGAEYDLHPQAATIFGVQVMVDPKNSGASAYKFGLKSRRAM